MKRIKPVLLFALLLIGVFLASTASLGALEVGATFDLRNLGFRTDRAASDSTFPATDFFWSGTLSVRHGISDNFLVDAGFSRDPILRNLAYSAVQYRMEYFSLGIGLLLGFLNSPTTLMKSGISTSARLELPLVGYVSLRTDNSLDNRLSEDGDYTQQRNELSVGFYARNAIWSLNLSQKEFAQLQAGVEIVDGITSYSFKTEIFQKNVPFRLGLSLAYQSLSRRFLGGASEPTHTLASIIVGTRLDLLLSSFLTLVLDADSSIYTFGQNQLAGVSYLGFQRYLFQASVGFRLDFEALSRRRAQAF